MKDHPDILVLTSPADRPRLTQSIPACSFQMHDDPFASLTRLAAHAYSTVLVSAPQPDMANLLRAVRKLQPASKVYVLCTPACEYDLSRIALADGGLIDDYFIMPPTPREWRSILGRPAPIIEEAQTPLRDVSPTSALTTPQLARLLEACTNLDELAARVREMAGDICQAELVWASQGAPRPGIQRVLTIEDDPPRVLWATDAMVPDHSRDQWVAALRGLLPALTDNARRTAGLCRLAITDDLTGARNRRYFMRFAGRLLETARAKKMRATLLLYDIDDFKHYNDQYGHAAGDEILRETADLMKQVTRKHDMIARIGGDEFAVLFCDLGQTRQPNSQPVQTAYDLADRFRQAVNSHEFKSLGPDAAGVLSISGGLASFPWDGLTVEQLLARADEALHAAKTGGKNRIFLVGENNG